MRRMMAMTSLEELKQELHEWCVKTGTKESGIEFLIRYFVEVQHWSEAEAYEHLIALFKNGTIDQIKVFGKDNEEL